MNVRKRSCPVRGPGWLRGFWEVLGSQISWYSAHEGGEVVSPTHRPPLPPGMFLVLIFTRGWVDPRATERSEVNISLRNPVTPLGIDPGTVRLVAQRLNHYATPGPSNDNNDYLNIGDIVRASLWSQLLKYHTSTSATQWAIFHMRHYREKTTILPKTLNNISFCHIYLV
jgi:hypothetical protein